MSTTSPHGWVHGVSRLGHGLSAAPFTQARFEDRAQGALLRSRKNECGDDAAAFAGEHVVRPRGGLIDHRFQADAALQAGGEGRSEEHTSELQSLMRISYAVFCLKKK